jgi:hypothetical protein
MHKNQEMLLELNVASVNPASPVNKSNYCYIAGAKLKVFKSK